MPQRNKYCREAKQKQEKCTTSKNSKNTKWPTNRASDKNHRALWTNKQQLQNKMTNVYE